MLAAPFPPGPSGGLRVFLDFRADTLSYLRDGAASYGDIVMYPMLWAKWFSVVHPDHVQRVLVDNYENYTKSWPYQPLRHTLGNGLVPIDDGGEWLIRNRMARPALKRKSVDSFSEMMVQQTAMQTAAWDLAAEQGRPVDILSEMKQLALNIVLRALFSSDVEGEEGQAVAEAFVEIQHRTQHLQWRLLKIPEQIPTSANRRYLRARKLLSRFIFDLLKKRRQAKEDRSDLLEMMMLARDEQGSSLSDAELHDEMLSFLFAGHETSANALAFAWYLLAKNPGVAGRVEEEVASALGDESPSLEHLPSLPLVQMVVLESLRLYPPVWLLPRVSASDDIIGGYRVPARSIVSLCPYITHRHPDFWDSPDEFIPERFENPPKHKCAYLPFLHGPRKCLGKNFALTEASLAIAYIAQRYSLNLPPHYEINLEPMVTLAAEGGMPMILSKKGSMPSAIAERRLALQ